jgi:hypothetical protein
VALLTTSTSDTPAEFVRAFLATKRTGKIILHVKDGRILFGELGLGMRFEANGDEEALLLILGERMQVVK